MTLSKTEINLRRLLDRYQKQVDQVVVNYSSNTPISFVMEKFKAGITYMHILLSTLERENCDRGRIREFRERIELLASLVQENSAFVGTKTKVSQDASMLTPSEKIAESDRISKVKKIAQDELRNELLTNDHTQIQRPSISIETSFARPTSSTDQSSPPKSISPMRTQNTSSLDVIMSSSIRNRKSTRHELLGSPRANESSLATDAYTGDNKMLLDHNKRVHEELSDQLAQMASTLKSNSVMFKDMLKKDKSALNDLDRGMESSLSRLKSETIRLGALSMSSRGSTCMVIFIVLFVCIAFMSTLFFMRIFRVK